MGREAWPCRLSESARERSGTGAGTGRPVSRPGDMAARAGVAGRGAACPLGREAVASWAETLRNLPAVSAVQEGAGSLQIVASDGPGLIAPAVQSAQQCGVEVTGVDVREPDLEAVFLHLTGKALRD